MLTAHFATEHFYGTVRDDFIDIHIRLRPTTCLPDTEWKMVIQGAVNNLLCRPANRFLQVRFPANRGRHSLARLPV